MRRKVFIPHVYSNVSINSHKDLLVRRLYARAYFLLTLSNKD